jgi:hypothetical protein
VRSPLAGMFLPDMEVATSVLEAMRPVGKAGLAPKNLQQCIKIAETHVQSLRSQPSCSAVVKDVVTEAEATAIALYSMENFPKTCRCTTSSTRHCGPTTEKMSSCGCHTSGVFSPTAAGSTKSQRPKSMSFTLKLCGFLVEARTRMFSGLMLGYKQKKRSQQTPRNGSGTNKQTNILPVHHASTMTMRQSFCNARKELSGQLLAQHPCLRTFAEKLKQVRASHQLQLECRVGGRRGEHTVQTRDAHVRPD